ncbi:MULTISPECIES: MFS transporter [unclassified Novosphingobium]|uniref:MFS transporter n=1 Tax=unclassified Novosphingobium TaxID=2644732 RepID=UPI0025F70E78|nr:MULTISPECIES: MFS transporter [unclassified Novosphingobium]HQV04582.1 MFS transporter [Novosphingobium sp.]
MPNRWPDVPDEFRNGWKIILGCSLGIASGVAILFLSFSLFVVPLTAELQVSRGELSNVQALIITAAIGSPLIGRLTDIYGVRRVYASSALLVALTHLAAALFASNLVHMGLTIALVGLVGAGTGTVVLSRPINAAFSRYRGTALGLMAVGVSVLAILAPPLLNLVIENWGWRGAFTGMALVSLFAGIPAVLLLVPDGGRSGSGIGSGPASRAPSNWRFLRERDFWFLALALITMSLATAGAASQLAPMVQDSGVSAATAALALSFFSGGTFIGRLGGGWLLDRIEPRRAAFLLTMLPALGFVALLTAGNMTGAIMLAVLIIGIQQGAEIDIFAFLVGRRFDLANYSAIYGALVGLGWIGNVGGLLGMGKAYDLFGSYAPAQLAAIGCLAVSAFLLLSIKLPERQEAKAV